MKHVVKPIRLPAFTVLELTVVLALMSTVITIISVSLNRFNEQLKTNVEVHAELNDWYAFRSNLWRELYNADSLVGGNNEVTIFSRGKSIGYRVTDEVLERNANGEWISEAIAIESIVRGMDEDNPVITFNFIWKEDIMELRYQQIPQVKHLIDTYFEQADE